MRASSWRHERGYAMAALLVGMSIMAIMLSVAMPVWRTAVQREREAELVFRGEQYAHAIELFQRRTGGYPPSLDVLEKTRAIRKLYKDPMTGEDFQPVFVGQIIAGTPVVPGQQGRGGTTPQTAATQGRGATPPAQGRGAAPSPFTGGGVGQAGFGRAGQPGVQTGGPIIGVISKSEASSLRLYNGRGKYNEWAFVATAATQQAGAPTGAQTPGGRGGQDPFGRGAQPGRGRGGQPPVNPPGRGFQQPGTRGVPFPGGGVQPPARGGFPGAVQPGTQVPGAPPTPPR